MLHAACSQLHHCDAEDDKDEINGEKLRQHGLISTSDTAHDVRKTQHQKGCLIVECSFPVTQFASRRFEVSDGQLKTITWTPEAHRLNSVLYSPGNLAMRVMIWLATGVQRAR